MSTEKVEKAVAIPQEQSLERYESLRDELSQLADLDAGESFEIAKQVINAIAAAETLEDIFDANTKGGPLNVRDEDIIEQPLYVYDVRWWRSADKYSRNNLGVYAVLDVFFEGGEDEPFKVSTGAPNVVASIRMMQKLGLIDPGRSKAVELVFKSRETGAGALITVGKPPVKKTK